ncbi:MAG: gluzincin family metallopeptidase [Sulfuricaulis sp.]
MAISPSKAYLEGPVERLSNRSPFRRLQGYAFDPSLSLRLETASINHTVFEVRWEDDLRPGPRGEYVEVVDVDPASNCWYEPVDLNALQLLAQDGLAPSEGSPQFHQQMAYAVAMNTIGNFERALGRQVLWAARDLNDAKRDLYVSTLRIYPHALRAANAYYSPQKRALLFGYFQGPQGTVFSCLSQDIVAHETTHALLDGMHRRYVENNHPDTLAFHEAFADLVALLHALEDFAARAGLSCRRRWFSAAAAAGVARQHQWARQHTNQ